MADPSACADLLNARVADGTVSFDGTWADACINKIAAGIRAPPVNCDGLHGRESVLYGHGTPGSAQISECRMAVRGLVQQGGSCEYEMQCAEGLACKDDVAGNYVCQAAGLGTKCNLDSSCDDGLVCNNQSSRCAMLGSVGAQCLYADDCEDGLVCSNFSCRAPVQLGASCAGAFDSCDPGTGCSLSNSTCISLGISGSPCSFSGECQGRCDTSLNTCTSTCGGTTY